MDVSAELRALLEQQVRAAEEAYEDATGAFNHAQLNLHTTFNDLRAYRQALEAATRETDRPYHPPPVRYPLDWPPPWEQRSSEAELKPTQPPPANPKPERVEKPTKKGIILATLAAANGNGMKPGDVAKAIPADAPIKITKADVDRALPRLYSEEKAWRDKRGYYHAGWPPPEETADSGFLEELEKI